MGYGFRAHRKRIGDLLEPASSHGRVRRLLRYSGVARPKQTSQLVYDQSKWRTGLRFKQELSKQLRESARPSLIFIPTTSKSTGRAADVHVDKGPGVDTDAISDTVSELRTNDSLASLGSDDSVTGQHEVFTLLVDLVVQERTRRRCVSVLQSAEAELVRLEDTLGVRRRKLQQSAKSQTNDRDLIDKYKVARKITKRQSIKTLEQIRDGEIQLRAAEEEQSRLQPQLYRAARGFLSNMGVEGNDEDGLSTLR